MSTNTGAASAQVLLVGLSFRSAPVTLLEKLSVTDSDSAKLQAELVDNDVLSEAMMLSTCNRKEFYTVANAFHAGLDHVVATISEFSGVPAAELEPHLYVHYADSAVEHMLNVASGLDSMVVGEQQIIGQLRSAYQAADANGTVGRTLHDLSQRALRTGKRVHSETSIDGAGASMVSFAVDRALRFMQPTSAPAVITDASHAPLASSRALIIGAGAMASLASTYLGKLGIQHITVANRTVSRAQNLANHAIEAGVQATAVGLDEVPEVLDTVDLVVSCTGAVGNVVTAQAVGQAQLRRATRPLVLVDLSMPRDIEQACADIDGVHLLNIQELTTMAGEGFEDEDPARAIVMEELESFLQEQRARSVVPTVKALRQRGADLVAEELAMLEKSTPGLSEADREQIARSMRHVVDKLLHTPTVQAKKLSAGGASVSYPDALAALFNLPVNAVDTVTDAASIRAAGGER